MSNCFSYVREKYSKKRLCMIKKRETWLDSFKGLGILLVVLGHCFPPERGLTNYLYSFHIALFFFASGYLLPKELYRTKFRDFLQGRFHRLMIPYFSYGLFTYMVWLLVGRNFGMNKQLAVNPFKPFLGIFYGNGFDNYLVFNIAIWFLPALFCTLILYYVLFNLSKNKITLLLVVIASLCLGLIDSKYSHFRLPWGINISFIAIFFTYIGHQGKGIMKKIDDNNSFLNLGLSILLIIGGYFLQKLNSGVSFNSHSYGNAFYFLTSAISSILGYSILTKVALDNKILQFLGINSLKILALHILSFSFISAFLKIGFQVDFASFKITLTGRIVYFISSIIIVSTYSYVVGKIETKLESR